jgi:hypothetical protein
MSNLNVFAKALQRKMNIADTSWLFTLLKKTGQIKYIECDTRIVIPHTTTTNVKIVTPKLLERINIFCTDSSILSVKKSPDIVLNDSIRLFISFVKRLVIAPKISVQCSDKILLFHRIKIACSSSCVINDYRTVNIKVHDFKNEMAIFFARKRIELTSTIAPKIISLPNE